MMKDYDHFLKNGKPANISYQDWNSWQARMRKAAEAARQGKCSVTVKVMRAFSRGSKVTGAITFTYIAATDSVAVAADNVARDVIWPLPEIAHGAAQSVGAHTDELFRAGRLAKSVTAHPEDLGGPLARYERGNR